MTEAYRHDEIAKLAYELWERRGRPLGSPEIDWYAVESTLGVRDLQGQFSLPGVRLSRKRVPIANPEFSVVVARILARRWTSTRYECPDCFR